MGDQLLSEQLLEPLLLQRDSSLVVCCQEGDPVPSTTAVVVATITTIKTTTTLNKTNITTPDLQHITILQPSTTVIITAKDSLLISQLMRLRGTREKLSTSS